MRDTTTPPGGIGCYCGCGESTDSHFAQRHDSKVRSYLGRVLYGDKHVTVKKLARHGYGSGPDDSNLRDEYDNRRLSSPFLVSTRISCRGPAVV